MGVDTSSVRRPELLSAVNRSHAFRAVDQGTLGDGRGQKGEAGSDRPPHAMRVEGLDGRAGGRTPTGVTT